MHSVNIISNDPIRNRIRIIYNFPIWKLDTPLALLLPTITSGLGVAYPERKPEVQDLISSGIRIRLDHATGVFFVGANVKEKIITLGISALERIWAYIYFYLSAFDLQRKHAPGTLLDLRKNSTIAPARKLAMWAHKCELSRQQTPWPAKLPRPSDGTKKTEKTNRYFAHVMFFITLHEIGHIVHNDEPSKYQSRFQSHKCEYDADRYACEFILNKLKVTETNETELVGRCTAIAMGLASLVGVELYHRAAVDDHPSVPERLLNFIEQFNQETNGDKDGIRDFPLYMASTIIQAHFINAGVPFALSHKYDNFSDYLISAARAYTEFKRK